MKTLSLFLALASTALAGPSKPSIIVMMADDLGYGDTGFIGNKVIQTPNLDALASQGVTLTQFYAGNSVCSPTRGTFLTGRHHDHYGIWSAISTWNSGLGPRAKGNPFYENGVALDGNDESLKGGAEKRSKSIPFRYSGGATSLVKGDYKLLMPSRELHDLSKDRTESNNLAATMASPSAITDSSESRTCMNTASYHWSRPRPSQDETPLSKNRRRHRY